MKRSPSPALVISITALFVALGGTSYAAVKINGKNIKQGTVTSKQIKNKSIKKIDLAKDARIAGPTGAVGKDGRSPLEGSVASGELIKGNFATAFSNGSAGSRTFYSLIAFPVRISGLTESHINFKSTGATSSDADASCAGTANAPAPPPGKLCLYNLSEAYSNNPTGLAAGTAGVADSGLLLSITLPAAVSYTSNGIWAYRAP